MESMDGTEPFSSCSKDRVACPVSMYIHLTGGRPRT